MKRNGLILVFLLGISFFTAGFAQRGGGLSVCVEGNGDPTVTDLRGFWVIVYSEDGELQKRYFQLDSGTSHVVGYFKTHSPVGIKLRENPINSVFACEAPLPPNTHSVVITITSPPDFKPSCQITVETPGL